MGKSDRTDAPPEGDAPPNPMDAMRAMMSQAWSAPWTLAERAAETQSAFTEAWRRNVLEFAERNAVFKTRIQKGGRISVPEGERDALGLEEGDLVQVVIVPIRKRKE